MSYVPRSQRLVNRAACWRRYRLRRPDGTWFVRCGLCGVELSRKEFTVDHRIPRSLGGTHAPHNLRPACETCNIARGDSLA